MTLPKPKSKSNPKSKNTNTPKPQPGRQATTLSITNMSPKPKVEPKSEAELAKPQAAVVHDLTGFALIALPPTLRTILGDLQLISNTLELEALQITVIVRETGVVVYVNLPVLVKEMETSEFNLTKGSLVLRDIVANNVGADESAAGPKAHTAGTADEVDYGEKKSDKAPPKSTRKGKGRA